MERLLSQNGIEQMGEPDACFLQLLPDDRGVHLDIGRVDLHFARWMIAGRTLSAMQLASASLVAPKAASKVCCVPQTDSRISAAGLCKVQGRKD